MRKTRIALFAIAALATAGGGFLAGEAIAQRRNPNIDAARRELNQALVHLRNAPDIFGGHKARAVELIQGALAELRAADAMR